MRMWGASFPTSDVIDRAEDGRSNDGDGEVLKRLVDGVLVIRDVGHLLVHLGRGDLDGLEVRLGRVEMPLGAASAAAHGVRLLRDDRRSRRAAGKREDDRGGLQVVSSSPGRVTNSSASAS